MQRLTLVVLSFLLVPIFGKAQQTPSMLTAKISTPTVRGEKCKLMIEDYMRHEDGVYKINVDWRRKVTTVTYFTSRTNIENIKTAIANVGFDADSVSANPDSYKALPLDCKKAADGGPPDKQN